MDFVKAFILLVYFMVFIVCLLIFREFFSD